MRAVFLDGDNEDFIEGEMPDPAPRECQLVLDRKPELSLDDYPIVGGMYQAQFRAINAPSDPFVLYKLERVQVILY